MIITLPARQILDGWGCKIPKFLEDKLRKEAAAKGFKGEHADHYVYGAMNNLGAMAGNKETSKGRAMEQKHHADLQNSSMKRKHRR
jgi:hypothetical protein